MLRGERLSPGEKFRVGLQSSSVKPSYLFLSGITGYLCYKSHSIAPPFIPLLTAVALLGLLHNYAMGEKLEKLTDYPEDNKEWLWGKLENNNFRKIRSFLSGYLYW